MIATSLSNLSSVLTDAGELAEARTTLERALAICEAQLGPDHQSTARIRTTLAKLRDLEGGGAR